MIVTGIGSRKVPEEMYDFITRLPLQNHIVRSGGAKGCDTAFEQTTNNLEIFIPWSGFSNNGIVIKDSRLLDLADEMISIIHPAYNSLSQGAKKLHTRNVFQIFGKNLDPNEKSDMVICWTPDGAYDIDSCTRNTGGTATAIKLASLFDIPVYNLYNEKHMDKIHDIFELW